MPNTNEPAEGTTTEQQREYDVFRVELYVPDRESLAQLLQQRPLDVGPSQLSPEGREFEVTIFVNEEEIATLREEGWRLEVHENLSEVGRSRQKEVREGDRFEGGRIPPKGLGTKTGKRDQ